MDRAFGLIRALERARTINDKERPLAPGVVLRLTRALMWLPFDLQPASIDDVLEEAGKVYGADPHQFESVVDPKASQPVG